MIICALVKHELMHISAPVLQSVTVLVMWLKKKMFLR